MTTPLDPNELLSAPQAAAELGVHRDTTRRVAAAGEVTGARLIGTTWAATRAAWQHWHINRRPAGRPAKPQEVTQVTSYRDAFASATERMITALREAGHDVRAYVTGSVWVNGVEIRPNDWDRLAMMGEAADVLEFVQGRDSE